MNVINDISSMSDLNHMTINLNRCDRRFNLTVVDNVDNGEITTKCVYISSPRAILNEILLRILTSPDLTGITDNLHQLVSYEPVSDLSYNMTIYWHKHRRDSHVELWQTREGKTMSYCFRIHYLKQLFLFNGQRYLHPGDGIDLLELYLNFNQENLKNVVKYQWLENSYTPHFIYLVLPYLYVPV